MSEHAADNPLSLSGGQLEQLHHPHSRQHITRSRSPTRLPQRSHAPLLGKNGPRRSAQTELVGWPRGHSGRPFAPLGATPGLAAATVGPAAPRVLCLAERTEEGVWPSSISSTSRSSCRASKPRDVSGLSRPKSQISNRSIDSSKGHQGSFETGAQRVPVRCLSPPARMRIAASPGLPSSAHPSSQPASTSRQTAQHRARRRSGMCPPPAPSGSSPVQMIGQRNEPVNCDAWATKCRAAAESGGMREGGQRGRRGYPRGWR